ncbi:MAG: DUF1439 domain-containing protein [Thermodesulfobacteriota bacterium]|nr:DUF1439 domain-containing protein [Thermodesulfobacteriota bacterium]
MTINKHIRRLFIAMLFCLMQCADVAAYTVELTKQQVQDTVEHYFPIEHVTPFAKLTLYRPIVFLEQKSSRIGLEFSMSADVTGIMTGKGRGSIDGDLEYRQETGEFYLHDPKIRRLDIHDFPADIASSIQQALQELMRHSLPVILVYRLKDDNVAQRITKSILSSVAVRNGKLILELSDLVRKKE